MVKRSKRPPLKTYMYFGGKVDDTDRGTEVASFCKNITDQEASFQLNIKSGGLAYWIAAIRESLRKLAFSWQSQKARKGEDDSFNTLLESYRKKLNAGDILLHEILSKEDLYLSLENMLSPLSHWITLKD